MTTSNYNKPLVIAVVILALSNLSIIGFLWLNKPHKPAPGTPQDARGILISQLQMDTLQKQQFDVLRKAHFDSMMQYREQMRGLKDALFAQLKTTGSQPDSLAQVIGDLQTKMDLTTFHHFEKVRAILKPSQQDAFDRVIESIVRNMGAQQPPRRMQPGERPMGPPPPGEHPPVPDGEHDGPPPPQP